MDDMIGLLGTSTMCGVFQTAGTVDHLVHLSAYPFLSFVKKLIHVCTHAHARTRIHIISPHSFYNIHIVADTDKMHTKLKTFGMAFIYIYIYFFFFYSLQ